MATRKAAKKSTKKYSAKKPTPRPKAIAAVAPGNDPIIVGGGSVFVDFDTKFTAKVSSRPNKRKFQDSAANLTELVIIRGGVRSKPISLNPTDVIEIYYDTLLKKRSRKA